MIHDFCVLRKTIFEKTYFLYNSSVPLRDVKFKIISENLNK